jgi:hypothetical protein
MLGPISPLALVDVTVLVSVVSLIGLLGFAKKTHDRLGRGCLRNFNLSATSPTLTEYQYDPPHYACCHSIFHSGRIGSPAAPARQAGKVPN